MTNQAGEAWVLTEARRRDLLQYLRDRKTDLRAEIAGGGNAADIYASQSEWLDWLAREVVGEQPEGLVTALQELASKARQPPRATSVLLTDIDALIHQIRPR